MPMNPSSPMAATASAGNRAARSHSALLGASFSAAKLRAMSRIMACCSVNAMGGLPGKRFAVVVEEFAGIGGLQFGDHLAQPADAVWNGNRGARAAHIGL